jgi:hypothetical protein
MRDFPAGRRSRLEIHGRRADSSGVRLYFLPNSRPPESVRVSDVLAAMSFALDLADGQPAGHALRTTLTGMELARRLRSAAARPPRPLLRADAQGRRLLEHVGACVRAVRWRRPRRAAPRRARRLQQLVQGGAAPLAYSAPGRPWPERLRLAARLVRDGRRLAAELVETRARRGEAIVRRLGFNERVAEGVGCVDERWDGAGRPRGLRAQGVPMLSRVIAVAQLLEVHATVCGADQAVDAARRQRGRWLDPHLVDVAEEIAPLLARWGSLDEAGLRREVREVEPGDAALLAGPGTLECIAEGFAEVVDAKSPFTAQHSSRVCGYALGIADMLGFAPEERDELNRAALLTTSASCRCRTRSSTSPVR